MILAATTPVKVAGHGVQYYAFTTMMVALAALLVVVVFAGIAWVAMNIYFRQQENKRARRTEQLRLVETLQRIRKQRAAAPKDKKS